MSVPRGQVIRTQRGLTLIELMISITIGLVVIGAVSYMYLGSKGAYRGNESQARIQEAGRFALDAITNDIRRAGGLGCGTLESVYSGSNVSVNVIPPTAGVNPIAVGSAINGAVLAVDTTSEPIPIQGLTLAPTYPQPPATAPPGWTPLPGPAYRGGDILQLQISSGWPVRVTNNPDTVNGNIQIASNAIPNSTSTAPNFNANDFVVLANCSSAAVFQTPTTPTGSPPLLSYKVGGTVPTLLQAQQLGYGLGTYSTVQHFDQVTYYLGTVPGSANAVAGSGTPSALYRYSLASGTAQEVADNVEDIDVSYGVGAGATVFKSANALTPADWPNVVSVRVSLIAVGDQLGIVSAPQTFPFHGAGTAAGAVAWTAPDTRLRQVFTVTATLRDRLQ